MPTVCYIHSNPSKSFHLWVLGLNTGVPSPSGTFLRITVLCELTLQAISCLPPCYWMVPLANTENRSLIRTGKNFRYWFGSQASSLHWYLDAAICYVHQASVTQCSHLSVLHGHAKTNGKHYDDASHDTGRLTVVLKMFNNSIKSSFLVLFGILQGNLGSSTY